jgi:hypothetical protein
MFTEARALRWLLISIASRLRGVWHHGFDFDSEKAFVPIAELRTDHHIQGQHGTAIKEREQPSL